MLSPIRLVVPALLAWGLHPQLVRAIMRENMGGLLHPIFPGMATDGIEINFNRSGRQGGAETTSAWNSAMHLVLKDLHAQWLSRGF
eukprot:1382087-Pyramimonas_sp.AAC.1